MTALLLGIAVGALYGGGAYLLLQRSLGQAIVGLALLANATNLLIFVASGVSRGGPPLIAPEDVVPPANSADPLPQALVLTAIVIGFAVLGFFIALATRAYRVSGDDLDAYTSADRIAPPEDAQ